MSRSRRSADAVTGVPPRRYSRPVTGLFRMRSRDLIETVHQSLKRIDGLVLEEVPSQLLHEIARELERVFETIIAELDHRANWRLGELGQSSEHNGVA